MTEQVGLSFGGTTTNEIFKTLAQIEEDEIRARLIAFKGNKTMVARSLGIVLRTLYNKMRQYDMPIKGTNGRPKEYGA